MFKCGLWIFFFWFFWSQPFNLTHCHPWKWSQQKMENFHRGKTSLYFSPFLLKHALILSGNVELSKKVHVISIGGIDIQCCASESALGSHLHDGYCGTQVSHINFNSLHGKESSPSTLGQFCEKGKENQL